MIEQLDAKRRGIYGVASLLMLLLAIGIAFIGFALRGVWPGLSLAVGAALGLVGAFVSLRWLRAAVTAIAPSRRSSADAGRGAV